MDDLVDPHEGKTYKLRAVFGEEVEEVEMSAAQVLDLGAGRVVAYAVRDDVAVEEDGTIVSRESAIPDYRDAA